MLDGELGQRGRGVHQLFERGLAFAPHEAVRIVLLREKQKLDLLAVLDMCDAVFQRTPGGFAPGAIAVEAEDDLVRLAQQLLHVPWCGRGPQRSTGIADAELRERDDIHISLYHENPSRFADGRARLRQAVQLAALLEYRRLRRVEVLRLAFVQDPAAESDYLPTLTHDRK